MKKLLQSTLLTLVLIVTPLCRLVRAQQLAASAAAMSKVKADIAKRLKNGFTNVTIKLRNGSELRGRITQTSETMFTLKEDKTRNRHDISYVDVFRIRGGGLSQGAKLGILTSIISGSVVFGVLMSLKSPASAH
jgi:small nuclear ribonucleoprotein (snRNP)-like protein